MAIPGYQAIMLPLLELAADGHEHNIREAISELADQFNLSEAERKELLPSGLEPVFSNRVHWARTYLKKALLLQNPRRAHFQITDRGREVLSQKPGQLNVAFLKRYLEFEDFYGSKNSAAFKEDGHIALDISQTPEETMADGYLRLRQQLESSLLAQVKLNSPEFFERLVIRVLLAMGYGGSIADAGKAFTKSRDEGIDGVIKEDRLGLDLIYVQAKRWQDIVGRPEIQRFVGALHGKQAKRGIFITTSDFTKDAHDYAKSIEVRVVLINGATLAHLMFEYGIGTSTISTYAVKRIDSDFLNEDDG
jgi:restriction system protein